MSVTRQDEISGIWVSDEAIPENRRPRDQRIGGEAGGPDRCPVGAAGAAVASWQEGGQPAEMDETAAHRRDPVRTRCGKSWRDVPERYGHCQTVYGLFRRWQRAGVWALLLKMLQAFADAAGRVVWEVSVDSTIARAHRHAAGARHDGHAQLEPPGGVDTEPADHGLGRSRGGSTTKTHLP
jgi:transposase